MEKITIIPTFTEKGDITIARKNYLRSQITSLEGTRKMIRRKLESLDPVLDTFEYISGIGAQSAIDILLSDFRNEESDLWDRFEEYNS